MNLLVVNPKYTWLTTQVSCILSTVDQMKDTKPKHNKRGVIQSLYNFLFGNPDSSADIEAIKNNMAILQENQDILSNQIRKHSILLM